MSARKAGLGDVGLELDFEEDAGLDDVAMLAAPKKRKASKAPTPKATPAEAKPAARRGGSSRRARSSRRAPKTTGGSIRLVKVEKRVHMPVYYDVHVRNLLLAAVETRECTKGEVVEEAVETLLTQLEADYNEGKPFPRVSRLKTGVVPPPPEGRERVRARDAFWVPEGVKERVRNAVGALQRQGYRMTVGYLVEQALEQHLGP